MVVSDPLPVSAFVGGIGGLREEEGVLWTEEGVESGKGEGLSVEVGGVGLEGAAIAECGEECSTL